MIQRLKYAVMVCNWYKWRKAPYKF